ncbi:MAG: PspC domain-containing protein [Candidatus Thermoplasmatota archaeon]|nr:PspC domain-containing protein [Candidatus Thermoplasmatota archaeon]
MAKKLKRSSSDKVLMGVCGGLGENMDIDPNIIRLIWVLGTLFSAMFLGVIAYFVMGALLEED